MDHCAVVKTGDLNSCFKSLMPVAALGLDDDNFSLVYH